MCWSVLERSNCAAESQAGQPKRSANQISVPEQTILAPPLVLKRGIGSALRRKLLEAQQKGQPAPDQSELLNKQSDANISSFGFAVSYECVSQPAPNHCMSCGRYPPQRAYRPRSCPLAQYGIETQVDLCAECLTSQGLLSHVNPTPECTAPTLGTQCPGQGARTGTYMHRNRPD